MIINKVEKAPEELIVRPTLEGQIECQPTKNIGLRGVVVADSTICKVDGVKGRLLYRGYDIVPLAERSTFEEVTYLLLNDRLPNTNELGEFKALLEKERYLPASLVESIKAYPREAKPMDILQATVSALAAYDEELDNESKDAVKRQSIRLIARFPLLVAAWFRIRQGKEIVEPIPGLSHAASFLYALHGVVPDEQTARDMDVALILHAEHSFNASTFTCRQVASTRAHVYTSVAAAIGALSGELHGGANERVLRMLEAIGSINNVENYVKKTLDEGGKIMGMGHAVYKTIDPRARFLSTMSKRLGEATGDLSLYEISKKVADVTAREFMERKNIEIYPNVDFFSASTYKLMGIPMDLFTPIFAVSRVSGWVAHYLEEKFAEAQPKPALYRPKADYIGRYCGPEGCDFVELERR